MRLFVRSCQKNLTFKNLNQVPAIDKIVLNMGIGEAVADSKKSKVAADDLERIAGQRASNNEST